MARTAKKPDTETKSTNLFKVSATPVLHGGKFGLLQGKRNEWFADIPAGTTLETILHPTYWVHIISKQVRPLDKIEAFCEDGSWEAKLRVMYVGRTELMVSLIYSAEHDQSTAEEDAPNEEFEVAWLGPSLQFVVRRKDNHAVVKDHLYPKGEALTFLRNHLQTLR